MDSLIIFGAKYLFIIVVLIFCAAWLLAPRKTKVNMAVAIVLAAIIAGILDKLTSKLFYDPRPFVTHHITPLVSHAADNGFPSEHTLFTFVIATVLYFYRPRLGILAGLFAAIVGICRVAARVHSPIDVVGGAIMGVAAGVAGYFLLYGYISRRSKGHASKTH